MKITKGVQFRSIRHSRRAASPAVSMVIITAATVVLVLVSGTYAFQVLERQQAVSEFDTIQKSMLAFDDAVRDIAWDRGGSRSIRFTVRYGLMRLHPENKTISVGVDGTNLNYQYKSAVVKYYMADSYSSLGSEYGSYILGDSKTVVSSITDSIGQVFVAQEAGFASIALSYRVRVSSEGPAVTINGSQKLNYVDIILIKLSSVNSAIGSSDFDLVAKNVGVTTEQYGPFPVGSEKDYSVTVSVDGLPTATLPVGGLEAGRVVFNLIISEVKIST